MWQEFENRTPCETFLNRCKPQHSHQSTFIKSARFTDSIQTGTDINTIQEKERNCDYLQYTA